MQVPFEQNELRQLATDFSAKAKTKADIASEVMKTGKKALMHGSVKTGLVVAPATIAYANLSAALNSPTYPQSLDSARHDFSKIEEFGSFDSNESNDVRRAKHERTKSCKF